MIHACAPFVRATLYHSAELATQPIGYILLILRYKAGNDSYAGGLSKTLHFLSLKPS